MKNIRPVNHITTAIVLIALLISGAVTLILKLKLTPLHLEVISTSASTDLSPQFFHDLDKDGFSELCQTKNDPDLSLYNLVFLNHQGAIIDQFNLQEAFNPKCIYFGDYTGDGYDECFVFTAYKDSLFLYAFDIAQRKAILERHFLMNIPDPHPYFTITDAALYDLHNDYNKELLFLVHAGLELKPRGLYVFDFLKKQVVNRFENAASKRQLIIGDLTGDGQDEIIVLSKANGNGPKNRPFTDWKNWIFILDHNLNLLFKPLSYGEYPSDSYALTVRIKGERYLLLAHSRLGKAYQKEPTALYLLDEQGRFARRCYFPYQSKAKIVVDNPDNLQEIYLAASSSLLKFDANLNLIKEKFSPFPLGAIDFFTDVNNDGKKDLIVFSQNGVHIFDTAFKLLARYTIDMPLIFSLRYTGSNSAPELGVNARKNFYHLKISKEPFFNWLPVLFVVFFVFIAGMLQAGNKLLTRMFTFFNYFMYSLRHTHNAVVILDAAGRLSYFNARTQTLLQINETLKRKMPFQQAFKEFPELTGCIAESMHSREAVGKEFTVNKGKMEIKGEIRVVPFKTNFNYIYAYLLEIRDFTEALLTDRHRVWSRTVRKIAHDIKTPLGSVLLNMERIQQKIEDENPEVFNRTRDDFTMTLSEIKRIQDMTRVFLKFSNLEAPNIQPVVPADILNNVLHHFRAYMDGGVQIELQLEKEAHFLYGDSNQLEMAFQIIIENAIDALKGKGMILVTSVLAQNLEDNFKDFLEIEIADNGPGIPFSQKDQIFEPFFSTKENGTGMGLTIARKIIQDHSGEIELISKENYGTVFRITLPATKGQL